MKVSSKTRVLIVDDSAFMRKMIGDILESDPRIEVIDRARNGKDALEKIKLLAPDVVTLDIEMPVMDGLTTLEKIMSSNPLPVLMISSSTTKGADKTLRAMSMGAVDFITKPSGPISLDIHNIQDEIIEKVLTAAKANIKIQREVKPLDIVKPIELKYQQTLVAIGASTGGPRALQEILTYLKGDFKATFLIVQHMPAGFTRSLAERLNSLTDFVVKEAEHGEIIQPRTAYIAPGNYHMLVRKTGQSYQIQLTQDEPVHNHRPSVNVLFNSIARLEQINKVGIILTGMGRDGADGVKAIKQKDNHSVIIAESAETAIVHGMPGAAINTKMVDKIIPLDQIGQSIEDLI